MKRLLIVRHCKAAGQGRGDELTGEGIAQAAKLADVLCEYDVGKIVSSPFVRAIQSIEPLAGRLQMPIEVDENLSERVLSSSPLDDWLTRLRDTFDDMNLKFDGGESSREAMERGVRAVRKILSGDADNTVIVTHGNLMTLILRHFDRRFGFEEWRALTNPDVYKITLTPLAAVERIWESR